MKKNLLILGGAGFIGSNFIRYILNKYPDYQIVNIDKLTYCGNLENLEDVKNNPHYTFYQGDICDKELLEDIFSDEKFDYIINFAAETHVDNSISDPMIFTKTNVLGTHNLLEIARKYKVEKFLQISTDEVYGSIEKGKFKESYHLLPNSPYSASKASADLLVMSYFKTFGLPVLITRSSNNFGQYQYPEKLIPLFITNLLENKKVPIYGTGDNVRDWIYVLDNCEGIDTVLHKGEVGEIYNIGGGNERTNLGITEMILTELGKGLSHVEYVEDRKGHDFRYALNINKIKKLGWKPKHSFKEAMAETIKWYTQNECWWKKLKN